MSETGPHAGGSTPGYQVVIEDTGEEYRCPADRDLLRSMERLGRKGIPAGCRGGGCGICKVHVVSGSVRSKKMSRAHVSLEEETSGYVLACRSYPLSDVRLTVIGKIRKTLCREIARPTPTESDLELGRSVVGPAGSGA